MINSRIKKVLIGVTALAAAFLPVFAKNAYADSVATPSSTTTSTSGTPANASSTAASSPSSATSTSSTASTTPSSSDSNTASSASTSSLTSTASPASSSAASSSSTYTPPVITMPAPVVNVDSSVSNTGTLSVAATNPNINTTGNSATANQDPMISNITVSGSVANDLTGPSTLDDIDVTMSAANLTPDNFLTPDGLHWSSDTEVITSATQTGNFSDQAYWGINYSTQNPTVYAMTTGSTGRITDVGETLSGKELDLLYTVTYTDQAAWDAGNPNGDGEPEGVAFTGEQYISGSDGNSIVVLYNGANNLYMDYEIVYHDTNIEDPVVLSFITTDIDTAQGVTTNLGNILTLIPDTTNLKTDTSQNEIYDANPTNTDLNGESSLPYGGYMGVGFLSNFYYNYDSPAPENNLYPWGTGVRYDLFGSSLQAHLNTQVRDRVYMNYYDADGNDTEIVKPHQFIWFPDIPWNVPAPKFTGYQYGNQLQYRLGNKLYVGAFYHEVTTVTFKYFSTTGQYLGSQSVTGLYGQPYHVTVPGNIGNYDLDDYQIYNGTFPHQDSTVRVLYEYVPPIVYYETYDLSARIYYANGYEYVPEYIEMMPSYETVTVPSSSDWLDNPPSTWTPAQREYYFRNAKAAIEGENIPVPEGYQIITGYSTRVVNSINAYSNNLKHEWNGPAVDPFNPVLSPQNFRGGATSYPSTIKTEEDETGNSKINGTAVAGLILLGLVLVVASVAQGGVDPISDAATAADFEAISEEVSESSAEEATVGRWMSTEEYEKMVVSGKVQFPEGVSHTYVSNPADINAYTGAKPGSIYTEFDVDSNNLVQGGKPNWSIIKGPGSRWDLLDQARGKPPITEAPDANNITVKGGK